MAENLRAGGSSTGYLGQLKLTANFAGTNGLDLTGEANNFYLSPLDALGDPDGPGTLVAGSPTLDLTSNERTLENFDLAVSGTVDGLTITGSIDSEFKLGNAAAVTGFTTTPLDVAGGGPTEFDAVIGAD